MAKKSAMRTRVVTVVKKGYRRVKNKKVSLMVVAGLIPAVMDAKAEYSYNNNGFKGVGVALIRDFTGFNPNNNYKFAVANLMQGLIPMMAGFGVHKLATRFGINRMLKAIPFVEI